MRNILVRRSALVICFSLIACHNVDAVSFKALKQARSIARPINIQQQEIQYATVAALNDMISNFENYQRATTQALADVQSQQTALSNTLQNILKLVNYDMCRSNGMSIKMAVSLALRRNVINEGTTNPHCTLDYVKALAPVYSSYCYGAFKAFSQTNDPRMQEFLKKYETEIVKYLDNKMQWVARQYLRCLHFDPASNTWKFRSYSVEDNTNNLIYTEMNTEGKYVGPANIYVPGNDLAHAQFFHEQKPVIPSQHDTSSTLKHEEKQISLDNESAPTIGFGFVSI